MDFSATCARADAILEAHFLQTDTLHQEHPSLDQQETQVSGDHSTGSESQDENDTVDQPSHQPLHLNRNETPDIVQLLIDSF